MTNSSQDGCFSSVLRRLICAGGLPTHPSASDNEQESYSTVKLPPPPPSPTTTPAGIVAKLMGIDSFPVNSPKLVSFMRKSKSVGSRDFFLPNFPHTTTHRHNSHTPHHRRVTTSVSFRELRPPTTLFFYDHTGSKSDDILNLTPIQLEKSNNLSKSDMGLTPVLQEKSNNLLRGRVHTIHEKNSSNKKKNANTEAKSSESQRLKVIKKYEQEVSSVSSKIRRKREVNAAAKKKKKKKKLLIDDGFPDEQLMYKSRDTRYNHPLPNIVRHEKKKKKKQKSILLKRRSESHDEYSQEYCMKALVEVCSLTMAEINEGGVWVDTKVMGVNNLQEISYQIAQHILYVLVYDMVDELCNC